MTSPEIKDPEISAMSTIALLLESLSPNVRKRIVNWATKRLFEAKEIKQMLTLAGHKISNPYEVLLKLERQGMLTGTATPINAAFTQKHYSLTEKGVSRCKELSNGIDL